MRLERAIILTLLDAHQGTGRAYAGLSAELAAGEAEFEAAIGHLQECGVVSCGAHRVSATPAISRLDELGLIVI
jgi:hypothetical protein